MRHEAHTIDTVANKASGLICLLVLLGSAAVLVEAGDSIVAFVRSCRDIAFAGLRTGGLDNYLMAALASIGGIAGIVSRTVALLGLFLIVELVLCGRPASWRRLVFAYYIQCALLLLWVVLLTRLLGFLFPDRGPSLLVIGRGALPEWLQAAAPVILAITMLLITDFTIYWLHRAQHRFQFLWRFHSVHHAIEELDAAHSFTHPIDTLVERMLLGFMFALVGFTAETIIWLGAFQLLHPFLIHTRAPVNLGPLGRALIDNRHHFRHHRVDAPRTVNFGSYVTLWDRLFGTYERPNDEKLPETGLRSMTGATTTSEFFLARLAPRHSEHGMESEGAPSQRPVRSWMPLLPTWLQPRLTRQTQPIAGSQAVPRAQA